MSSEDKGGSVGDEYLIRLSCVLKRSLLLMLLHLSKDLVSCPTCTFFLKWNYGRFINRQGGSRRGTLRRVWICIAACLVGQLPVAILLPTSYRPRSQESLMTATNYLSLFLSRVLSLSSAHCVSRQVTDRVRTSQLHYPPNIRDCSGGVQQSC